MLGSFFRVHISLVILQVFCASQSHRGSFLQYAGLPVCDAIFLLSMISSGAHGSPLSITASGLKWSRPSLSFCSRFTLVTVLDVLTEIFKSFDCSCSLSPCGPVIQYVLIGRKKLQCRMGQKAIVVDWYSEQNECVQNENNHIINSFFLLDNHFCKEALDVF